jgi:ESX secretion system protein EccA
MRSVTTDCGTALDLAGSGRDARKVVIACRRECARRLHAVAIERKYLLARASYDTI